MDHEEDGSTREGSPSAVMAADSGSDRPRPNEAPSAVDGETRCVVCLDAVSEPCAAQPCGHRDFDFLCLLSWLLHGRPTCPLCKAVVATVQYGFADDQCKTFSLPPELEDGRAAAAGADADADAVVPSSSVPTSAAEAGRRRRDHRRGGRDTPAPSSSSSSSPAALDRRRRVYRLGLYALHVGANRHSRYYRELTPRMFVQDPDLVSRARAFVRRELVVLLGDDDNGHDHNGHDHHGRRRRRLSTRQFLLEYVVAILQTMDTQGSAGQAEELLRDFFGRDRARLFLHELRSWLRSPYLTLESWDRHVQYGAPEKSFGSRADGPPHDGDTRREHDPGARRRSHRDGDNRQTTRPGRQPHRRGREAALLEACRRYDPS